MSLCYVPFISGNYARLAIYQEVNKANNDQIEGVYRLKVIFERFCIGMSPEAWASSEDANQPVHPRMRMLVLVFSYAIAIRLKTSVVYKMSPADFIMCWYFNAHFQN